MKKHHLIFISTIAFILLFYQEDLGLNLGLLGLLLTALVYYNTPAQNKTKRLFALVITSFLSSLAFAWYVDFPSFVSVFTSLFLLTFVSKNKGLKSLMVIPTFILSFLTSIFRVFQFEQWLPTHKNTGWIQRTVFVGLIPLFFVIVFLGIYALGSSHFSAFFENFSLDFDFPQLVFLSLLGFFIFFNFWNYYVDKLLLKRNYWLDNEFNETQKSAKPTYAFLSLEVERNGGLVTFLGLNILLIIFLFTFNYEQFIEVSKTPARLSEETHQSVVAVVISIIMAVMVILFYFKGSFNFDKKAKSLKVLAYTWLVLNAILVLSAFAKNTEYIIQLGLTYKRLGVYTFLILCLIGLFFTYLKVKHQKTNAYLFNQMAWYFYGTVLVCSFFNWGGIITYYNLKLSNFDADYHAQNISYNEKLLLEYYFKKGDIKKYHEIENKIKVQQKKSFLSKSLFYESF